MQGTLDQVSHYSFMHHRKTAVVHQPAPGKPYNEPTITVNGHKIKMKVVDFTYLGRTLPRAVHIAPSQEQ